VHSFRSRRNRILGYPKIESLLHLRELDLSYSSIPREALENILMAVAKYNDFVELNLSGNGGGSIGQTPVCTLLSGMLVWSSLSVIGLGDIGLNAIQSVKLFRTIRIGSFKLRYIDVCYSELKKATKLISACLSEMKTLEKVELTGNDVKKRDINILKKSLKGVEIICEDEDLDSVLNSIELVTIPICWVAVEA